MKNKLFVMLIMGLLLFSLLAPSVDTAKADKPVEGSMSVTLVAYANGTGWAAAGIVWDGWAREVHYDIVYVSGDADIEFFSYYVENNLVLMHPGDSLSFGFPPRNHFPWENVGFRVVSGSQATVTVTASWFR